MTRESLGRVVAEIQFAKNQAWETKLQLHVKPRPSWCPAPLWQRIVNLVLIQSEQAGGSR